MWHLISTKTLFTHSRLSVIEDTVQLPSGEQVSYVKYGGLHTAVIILCIQGEEVLIQSEYSYPPNQVLYQLPGGGCLRDEAPVDGARRELREEVGLAPGKIQEIGWFYMNNRRSDQKMHVFIASDFSKVSKEGGDKEEVITFEWVDKADVSNLIQKGEIVNYSLLAAWALFVSGKHSLPRA
jgi:ADP-ribose pyrophosphatase